MIKLVEVVKDIGRISLRDVFVNPKHVVYLREDNLTKKYVNESRNSSFDADQVFTKLFVQNGSSGTEFVVVGDPILIESKLKGKILLNG
jgi:hypothetical protein